MKKVILKDNSRNDVDIELETFVKHINLFHKTGTSIHEQDGHYFTVNQKFRDKLQILLKNK